MLDSIPWSNLPIIYGLIEISVSDIILHTWSKIDIPPKPNKNAEKTTLIPRHEDGTFEIKLTPDVNSIIPEKKGIIKFVSIFKKVINGIKICKNKVKMYILFNMESITLKKTTKPPIITTDFIELIILLEIIFPKSLIEIVL